MPALPIHTSYRTPIGQGLALALVLVGIPAVARSQPEANATPSATAVPDPTPTPADPSTGGFDLASLITPGGMTSEDVAERAIETSPSLARAHAAVAIAEATADRAFNAVLPRIDLSGRYTRLSDVDQGGFGAPLSDAEIQATRDLIGQVDDPEARILLNGFFDQNLAFSNFEFPLLLNQYVFRATLSYPISDLFLRAVPARNATLEFAEAERIRVESELAEVAVQAKEAYYQLGRARGGLAVANAALAEAESQREQVRALVAAGSSARVDLMRADAQVASAEVGVAQAENSTRIAETALRTFLHMPEGELTIGENLTEPLPPTTENLEARISTAMEQRAEVKALERMIQGNRELVSANEGGRWPSLSVQAGLDVANPNPRIFPQTEQFRSSWDINAVLSWSPNDYLDANEDVLEAEARLAQVEADRVALEDAVRLEVTNAHQAYRSATSAVSSATAGIEAAAEVYRVRRTQLAAGAGTANDVIDAESDLTRARLQLLDALIDQRIARARLERAIGP